MPDTIPLTPISSVSTDSNQSIDEISSRSIGNNRTVLLATKAVDVTDRSSDMKTLLSTSKPKKLPVTTYLTILGVLFGFFYNGCEMGYSGWIPAYSLSTGITTKESNAAYLEAIFWACS